MCQLNFGYFYRFVALVLQGGFRSAPPCGASLVLTAFCLYVFLLETQKEPKRYPPLPIARCLATARLFFATFLGQKKVGLMEESHNKRPCRKVGRAGQAANRTILAPHFHHFLPLIYPITAKVVYHFLTTFTV